MQGRDRRGRTTRPAWCRAHGRFRDRRRDPYQKIFNDIANDLQAYVAQMSPKAVSDIRNVSELQFFADMSPRAYGEHLAADEDGYGATVGIRGLVSDNFELSGSIGYVDLGDAGDGTAFGAEALYSFTENFALGFNVSVDDDVTMYGVGARFYFGN